MKIQIIRKNFNNKLLNKILRTNYKYKVDLNNEEKEHFIEVSIFQIKSILEKDKTYLKQENIKMKQLEMFKKKMSDSKLNFYTVKITSKELISFSDIHIEEHSMFEDVKLSDNQIKLMLYNPKKKQLIDVLNCDYGYKYLCDLIINEKRKNEFLGKMNWIEYVSFFLLTPLLTIVLRVLASVYSTGPFYKNYETSIVFYLILVLLANMIGLSTLVSINKCLFVNMLIFKETGAIYIFQKLLIIYLGFLFSLLLSSLLGIPMNILWMFGLFVSFFIYLPIFIALFIFLKRIVK